MMEYLTVYNFFLLHLVSALLVPPPDQLSQSNSTALTIPRFK